MLFKYVLIYVVYKNELNFGIRCKGDYVIKFFYMVTVPLTGKYKRYQGDNFL